jgi:hypothetical protein
MLELLLSFNCTTVAGKDQAWIIFF